MSKLMKKDFKVVENFKWISLISIIIIIAAVVCVIVRGGVNFGIDYTGGGKVEIELGSFGANKNVQKAFEDKYTKFIEEKGFKVVDRMQISTSGEGATYEFRLAYELNGEKFGNSAAQQEKFKFALNGDDADSTVNGLRGDLETSIKEYFETDATMVAEGAKYDEGSVRIYMVGATATSSLLSASIWAIVVALIVILVYIIIRFTFLSGIAAVIALIHDVVIMCALTIIFNIPVNSTFIAAVITIIGYSINSSIVVFDKVRECLKSTAFAYATDTEIANYSIKHSFIKILLSIVTTLIMVVAVVLFAVATIQEFVLPIIFGLISGLLSSLCLSPSLWVAFRKLSKKNKKEEKKA